MRDTATFLPGDTRMHHLIARQWLALALAVLIAAGLFALAVVLGRMPPFDRFVTDPLFFKRCLVAHVNLALVVWFYAFMSALLFLLPSRRQPSRAARASAAVAASGVALLLAGAALPGGQPLLSNYIPTINHWLFQLGQLVFAAGVLLGVLDLRLLAGTTALEGAVPIPNAAQIGLRAVAAAILLAAMTLAITLAKGTANVPVEVHLEFMVWGVGHVLQLVSTVAMVTVWIFLLEPALGAPPISPPAATALFTALVLPWSMAPLFALQGTDSIAYRHGFTFLMRWCLFPVVCIVLLRCMGAVVQAWRSGRIDRAALAEPRISAFLVSAALTVLGFGLGAAIRGSNTMVPAHYHASVGAVTVAFMAATYVLLPVFGVAIPRGWLARAASGQSAIYGLGMLIFAAGFAIAGAHGMGRKLYGAEQAARGLAQTIGLFLMGVGGFVSIGGGVLFLIVVAVSWWCAARGARTSAGTLTERSWRLPYEAK